MPTITMNPTLGDVLKHEYDRTFCRENGTLLLGRNLRVGAVLARRTVDPTAAGVVAAAVAGNAGNGTLTKDATAPAGANAKPGIYRVVFIAATKFEVFRPDGSLLGVGTVATVFDSEVKFNTAAGGTPFAAGDGFTITVPAGDGKYVQCVNAAQADGSHVPAALLLADTNAASADQPIVALVRGPAMVSASALVWDASIDDATKRAAKLATLTALGIVARTTA